jgi:enoyl-CoA hydratase/carnithine racemase
MVNRVVAGTDLEHAGLGVAGELAANVRALIDAGAPLDRDLEHELIALRKACFHSEDLREGVRAFTEKRRPRWRGM